MPFSQYPQTPPLPGMTLTYSEGSGPYSMIHNLTRDQMRRLALSILGVIG